MNKPRNRIGVISLCAAAAGFLLVTLQPWIPLARIILFDNLSLKHLLSALFDASLVGALADWFAVSALFTNPLGVKLPHTDILAKNKDSIAEAVPRFLTGFLSEENISAELARFDYGARLAELLESPAFRREMSDFLRDRIAPHLLGSTPSRGAEPGILVARLPSLIGRALTFLAGKVDLSQPLVGIMRFVVRERLHERIIAGAARLLARSVHDNRDRLVSILIPMIRRNSGWQGLFVGRRVVERLIDGLEEELDRVRDHPENEIRRILSKSLESFVVSLSAEGPTGARERALLRQKIQRVLTDASTQTTAAKLLGGMVERLREDLVLPESITLQGIDRLARALGTRLANDHTLRTRLNQEISWLLSGLVARSRLIEVASDYLASLLKATDEREFVNRIEEAVWNDLQYIRLNGAVVGGLVGLVLAILAAVL